MTQQRINKMGVDELKEKIKVASMEFSLARIRGNESKAKKYKAQKAALKTRLQTLAQKQAEFDAETERYTRILTPFAQAGLPLSMVAKALGVSYPTIQGRMMRTGLMAEWQKNNKINWNLFRGSKWEKKGGRK